MKLPPIKQKGQKFKKSKRLKTPINKGKGLEKALFLCSYKKVKKYYLNTI